MLTKLIILIEMLPFCAVALVVLYGFFKIGGIVRNGGDDTSGDNGTGGGYDDWSGS